MAQTTTAQNACDVVLQLDNGSGVLINISGSSNQANMDFSAVIGEAFTFEGPWAIKKSCKKAVAVALQVVYSTLTDEGIDLLRDWFFNSLSTSRSIQIDIPDSSVGSDRYSGEMTLESLSIPATADDAAPILCAAALSNDGEFSYSIIAS